MEVVSDYKILYEKLFYDRLNLIHDESYDIWERISDIFDLIAGPLYGVYTNDNWDYVYHRNDEYFSSVECLDDTIKWLNGHIVVCYMLSSELKDDYQDDRLKIESKLKDAINLIKLAGKVQLVHERSTK